MSALEPSQPDSSSKKSLTLKDRIEAHRGAGYGAMVGATAGAIIMGPLAPVGAIVGGAIGGGVGSIIDMKWRKKKSDQNPPK